MLNSFGQKNIQTESAVFDTILCYGGDIKQDTTGWSKMIFKIVEKMPVWKSCALDSMSRSEQGKCTSECLFEFIYKNIKYPRELCYSGKVIVQMTIQKNGKVSNFKFLRDYPESLEREIKKVFDKMPDWIPGTQGGIPVNVMYMIPIKFELT